MDELQEIHQLSTFHSSQAAVHAITAIAFDDSHELLWIGNDAGYVSSYYGLALQRYTAFRAHDTQVRQILLSDRGVLTLSASSLRLTNRRGITLWRLGTEAMQNLHCMTISPTSATEVIVAGQQEIMLIVSLTRGVLMNEVQTEGDIVVMRRSRLIVCGGMNGEVTLRDPKTLNVEQRIQAHSAMISDIEVAGNLLLTCGYSLRQDHLVIDPLVKVYDIRTLRSLSPLPFPSGPCLLKTHPKLSTTVLVASQNGQLQLCDIGNLSANFKINQINTRAYLTCMDVSPSGELMAFGDAASCFHMWGWDRNIAKMTPYSKEIETPTPPTPPPLVVDDNTPLSSVGMPLYTERLFSATWPKNAVLNSGRIPTPIDPDVLSSMKMIDFVGYAPNPGTKLRNQVSVSSKHVSAKSPGGPKFRSEQAKELYYGRYKEEESAGEEPSPISPSGMEMPKYQRRVEIKYSKFGVEDFDFGYYNKTAFGGLETHITNSYCNSLLQVLFFVPALRMIAKSHIGLPCLKEFCLTCELGFLFRMLEDADGQNCQATNFLRAFGTIPQAAALGLFEPEQPNENTSYGLLIQSLNRFIFEQIHQECNVADENPELVMGAREHVPCPSVIQQVFGLKMASQSKCGCGAVVTRTTYPFVVDLSNGKKPLNQGRNDSNANNQRRRFEDILQSSIRRDTITKAWCGKCSQYQMTKQTKSLQGFPFVLAINTSAAVMDDLERWSVVEADEDNKPWLPPRIGIVKDGDSYIIIPESRVEEERDKDVVIYELTAVLSQVQADNDIPHLIAHVKIPNSDACKLDSKLKTRGRWCLFNDFLVRHVSESEVFQPRGTWKVPAIMHYSRVDMDDMVVRKVLPATVDPSILYEDFSIAKNRNMVPRSFTPLTPKEGPKRGFFCGIDAEFIALNQEETEIRSDGTRSVLRPSRHSLARVSVLRGEGALEGVPFIDDYIATSEPIVDYLTEFSGIEAADLDPALTKHTLVPLKVAYKKLRLLVDMGVVFVGHGLVKDFRIINILVPPEQVIDTVNIWHIPNKQRKISLRFLAWYLLKQDIQKDSHDSIEDARTALFLYKKYVELQKEGTFGQVLEELYAEGRKCNWKPWGSPVTSSAVTGSPDTGAGGVSSFAVGI